MAEQLRQSIRSQKLEERKEERLKVVNSKRLHLPPEEEYEVMSLEQFSGMVREAASRRQFSQLLRKIKWGLSQGEEYIAAFLVTPNVVDRLVASLLRNDTAIQLEAAACITNIACGNHKATSRVVRAAGPYLITFLNGGNPFLQDQCAWALGNMASDCGQCSERLRAMGLCYAMVKALETPHEQALGSCLFCLRAYVDSSSADIQSLVSLGLLEKLCSLWKREPTPETLLSHLARATFSVYSRREDSTVTSKYSLEMCRLVTVHFLRHMQNKEPDITVLTPLVRCLATFAGFGWNSFSDAELGTSNVAACLGKLLKSPYLHLRRECLWLLNNLDGRWSIRP